MNTTAIIGIVILVLFLGSFIAYGVVLYLGREHKQTVLVKSKYTTKNREEQPVLCNRRKYYLELEKEGLSSVDN